jgi:hypothetical protein
VKAILLVPSDAFRVALLADGPCGARVPRLVWMPVMRFETDETAPLGGYAHPTDDGSWEEWDDSDDWQRVADKVALVLAWDGAVVREGRDRAAYALLDAAGIDPGSATAAAIWRGVHTAAWNMHMLDALGIELTDDRHACIHAGRSIEERLATVCAARGLGTVVVVP